MAYLGASKNALGEPPGAFCVLDAWLAIIDDERLESHGAIQRRRVWLPPSIEWTKRGVEHA